MTIGIRPLLSVWVPGRARTKGSMEIVNAGRGGRKPVLKDSELSTDWRRRVAEVAGAEWRKRHVSPCPDAVVVRMTAYFATASGDATDHALGDTDKLARLVGDALAVDATGKGLGAGVLADDDQIVAWVADKVCGIATNAAALGNQGLMVVVYRAPYDVKAPAAVNGYFTGQLTIALEVALTEAVVLSGVGGG